MKRIALSLVVLAVLVMGAGGILVGEYAAHAAAHGRDERDGKGGARSVVVMKDNDAAQLFYTSKEIPWTSGGGTARFRGASFIPSRGPNGGILMVKNLAVHATLNLTVATAALLSADVPRFARTIDVKTVEGVNRYENITGDSCRLISWAQLGPSRTHEHQSIAVAGAANYELMVNVPLSHTYAYDPNDTAVPSDFFDELAIGMSDSLNMSLGTSVVTVNSGFYQVVAECYETMSILLQPQAVWRQVDGTSTSQLAYEIDTGGRLMDLLFYCPGAVGGGSLANLSKAGLQFAPDSLAQKLTRTQFKHIYGRARGAAAGLFSTLGDPVRSDPFVAANSGTLRALAIKLSTGSKVTDSPERTKEMLQIEIASALPANARVLARFMTPKSERQRAIIEANHQKSGNTWYVKTRDKSRRSRASWPADMLKYLPEKWVMAR